MCRGMSWKVRHKDEGRRQWEGAESRWTAKMGCVTQTYLPCVVLLLCALSLLSYMREEKHIHLAQVHLGFRIGARETEWDSLHLSDLVDTLCMMGKENGNNAIND